MRTFLIDGTNLENAAKGWGVLFDTSPAMPAQQRSAVFSAWGSSRSVVARGGWEPGSQTLMLIVKGTATATVEANAAELVGVLSRARELTRVVGSSRLSVGVQRVAVAEPERLTNSLWRVSAILSLDPFWSEPSTLTANSRGVPGMVVFPEWAGSTGDVVDGVLRFRGPFTSVVVVASDGSGLSFDFEATASQYVFVDVTGFRAWRGGASAWEPSANRVLLDYPVGGPLVLSSSPDGVRFSVSGDGFGKESAVVLRGKRWWL